MNNQNNNQHINNPYPIVPAPNNIPPFQPSPPYPQPNSPYSQPNSPFPQTQTGPTISPRSNPSSNQPLRNDIPPQYQNTLQQYQPYNNIPTQQDLSGQNSNRPINQQYSNKFQFHGTASQLQRTILMKPREQLYAITDAVLHLQGIVVQQINHCIPCCCGCIFAYIYCLVNCILCCRCRQKVIYSLYQVHALGYEAVGKMVDLCPNLFSVQMIVRDNNLNQLKSSILFQILRRGRIRKFTFFNEALGVSSTAEMAYESFFQNFAKFKQLKIQATFRWQDLSI